ncbi:MAG: hypothetical protein Q4G64_02520 [bacterium]|nr:hypothetical protein [bacterium]
MTPMHSSDPRLSLSERSEKGVQAVALHWMGSIPVRQKHLNVPAPATGAGKSRTVKLAVPGGTRRTDRLFRSTPRGKGEENWLGVSLLQLPHHHMALAEVQIRGSEEDTRRELSALVRRVQNAAAVVRLPWFLDKGAAWVAWLAVVVMVVGLFILGSSPVPWARFTPLVGAGLLLLVTIAALVMAFVYAARRGRRTVPEQAFALLQNPWVLAGSAPSIGIATVFGAVLFWRNGLGTGFAIAYWAAIALGAVVVFLGSPHRLIRQVIAAIRRSREEPPPTTIGEWTEVAVSEVPPHVARPPGQILTAYRHSGRDTWATVAAAGVGEDPAWTRWNQLVTEWDSPRGKVSARVYQTWDRGVETIVEVAASERAIVIETPREPEGAKALARDLTAKLETPQEKERTRSRLTGFLRYSHAPVTALWIAAVLVWLAVLTDLGTALISQGSLRFVAIMLAATPLYLVAMSLLAILRPEWFRFSDHALRHRAYMVLWSAVGAAVVSIIPAMVWVERYWSGGAQALLWWGLLLGLLVVLPFLNRRIRAGKTKTARRRGRMER